MITNEMSMIRASGKVLNWDFVTVFNGSSLTFITACYDIRLVLSQVDY